MPPDKILAALSDLSTTYWLRDALNSSLRRDPVDALHDAEALADLLRERLADQLPPAVDVAKTAKPARAHE